MTGWDVLDKVIASFPPLMMALLSAAALVAVVILIVGFTKHGANFLKYGFKQMALDGSLEKRFDKLEAKFDTRFAEIDAKMEKMESRLDVKMEKMESRLDVKMEKMESRLDLRIEAIEVNHFGHLKDFLAELTSILLDKNIITNTDKARLDSKLRGM